MVQPSLHATGLSQGMCSAVSKGGKSPCSHMPSLKEGRSQCEPTLHIFIFSLRELKMSAAFPLNRLFPLKVKENIIKFSGLSIEVEGKQNPPKEMVLFWAVIPGLS